MVIDRAVTELGGIDIPGEQRGLPDGAGRRDPRHQHRAVDRVLKTNLYATFWLCKAAISHMRPGSSIIHTSSALAVSPSPHLLDYATTKGGIVAFTKGLGADLAGKGIRVNSVAPGPVWTLLIPATMDGEKVESFGARSPVGRAAQPAELVRLLRLPGIELHHRRGPGSDRRLPGNLKGSLSRRYRAVSTQHRHRHHGEQRTR